MTVAALNQHYKPQGTLHAEVGANVYRLMRKHKLTTQQALAEKSGIDRTPPVPRLPRRGGVDVVGPGAARPGLRCHTGLTIEETAVELLGLRRHEASALFDGCNTLAEVRCIVHRLIEREEAAMAGEMIRGALQWPWGRCFPRRLHGHHHPTAEGRPCRRAAQPPERNPPMATPSMKQIHSEPHPLADQTVTLSFHPGGPKIPGQHEYHIEDYWDRVAGESWMWAQGNPACLQYAVRAAVMRLPTDDEVVYGKVGYLGYLVHVSELPVQP